MKYSFTIKLKDLILEPESGLRAADVPPDKVVAMLQKAYKFLAANMEFEIRGDEVVITTDAAREQDVAAAQDIYERALAQARDGKLNKAVDLFRRVLVMVPQHEEARRNLATALLQAGRGEEAKDCLLDLLRLNPSHAWALMLLGRHYQKDEKNLEVAERFLEKAHEIDPHDVYALVNLAALKAEQKKNDEAEKLFDEATAMAPTLPNAYYGRALMAMDKGDSGRAWSILDEMFDKVDMASADDELANECREHYLRLSAVVAEDRHDDLMGLTAGWAENVRQQTGCPVEILEDESMGSTSAVGTPAWNTGRDVHEIRYHPAGRAVVPAMIGLCAQRILIEHEIKDAPLEKATGLIERIKGYSPGDSERTAAMVIIDRFLAVPVRTLSEARLTRDCPAILPSLFVNNYLYQDEGRKLMNHPLYLRFPAKVRQLHAIGAMFSSVFSDELLAGRSAYGRFYSDSKDYAAAHRLALEWSETWRKAGPEEIRLVAGKLVALVGLDA